VERKSLQFYSLPTFLDVNIVSDENFLVNPYEVYFYCVLKCVLVQNPEVGNFAGFEVIVKRTKDGRNISKEYIEFLRQRSVPIILETQACENTQNKSVSTKMYTHPPFNLLEFEDF
jgi:hypothetical protein